MKKGLFILLLAILLGSGIEAQVRIIATPGPSFTGGITGVSLPATNTNIVIGGAIGYSGATGSRNTIVGNNSIALSAFPGTENTFVGFATGTNTTNSWANTFIGQGAGAQNTIGSGNTFLGRWTGTTNLTGNYNTMLGIFSGTYNSSGDSNTCVGMWSGFSNTVGRNNTLIGSRAGLANTTGNYNVALGTNADFGSSALTNATAIGYNAKVNLSNAMVLGGTGADAVNIGIGTTAPAAHLHLFTHAPETVIFSTDNTTPSAASTLKLQTLTTTGGLQNGLDVAVSGPSAGSYILNFFSPTSVPALPKSNMGSVTTTSVPLMIGINGNENVSNNIHFINSIKNSSGSFIPTECMRINKDNGFVGIHSRTANSSSGTGIPQALLHVNLTNITSASAAGFNPLLNGIRFEGLPAANHPDVIVVDASGNLATRPYISGGGTGTIPCDSVIKCAWGLHGNTIGALEYIGTNNAQDFRFRTSGLPRGRVTVDGNWDFGANTFSAAVTSSAMGSNNTIQFSNAALASGANNHIGTNLASDYSTATGYQNTIDESFAAAAIGAKNDILKASNFATALGTINQLTGSDAAHAAGTANTIINSNSAIALGGLNNINSSSYAFTGGYGNTIQGNSDKSGAIGEGNQITASASSVAAGESNKISSCSKGTIALGADNDITGSNESAAIGERNVLTNGHGTIVAGGHNTTDGNYNLVLGSWSYGVSGMTRVAPKTPIGSNIMVIGEQITNSLNNSLTMGFNANRTMVLTERGVAIQMDPTGTFTFSPTHNLMVKAKPSPGVNSNIVFDSLPIATRPMPMVLVDANGELYQSTSTALRVAGGGKDIIADIKIQKDTKPITGALNIIGQIAPKQYTIDATQYPTLDLPTGKASFGFVAQELEKVLPGLVTEIPVPGEKVNAKETKTVKGINYMEMIPLLVQALKEQQAQINSQQNQINALLAKGSQSNDLHVIEKEAMATIGIQLSDADVIMLQQNVPNPGDRFTAIGFNIPASVKSASLSFTSMEGKTIKTVNITARGKGVFNLYTSGLSKGTYTYTLVVDGQIAETKKMVISR